MLRYAAALLIPALALPARAGPTAPQTEEIHAEVGNLNDAVADKAVSNPQVYEMAHNLFDRVPGTNISVDTRFRRWDTERVTEKTPASVDRLVEKAGIRLDEGHNVPAADLSDISEAWGLADAMNRGGSVSIGPLGETQMGVYEYTAHSMALGVIKLNAFVTLIATKLGDAFAFSTLIHEARHGADHAKCMLSPDHVIDGEVSAFLTQYRWLTRIDPYGERLVRLRAQLIYDAKHDPSRLNDVALAYADQLLAVRETGGDEDKIRRMVVALGYREGRGHDHGKAPLRS